MGLARGGEYRSTCDASQSADSGATTTTSDASDNGTETRPSDDFSTGLLTFAASFGLRESGHHLVGFTACSDRTDFQLDQITSLYPAALLDTLPAAALESFAGVGFPFQCDVIKAGDVVRVRDGYARNYLLPRGLVLVANKKNLKSFEHQKKVVAEQKEKIMRQARSVADQLASVSLTIAMRTGEEGKLFGSVTNIHLERALKAKGLDVDRRKIHLDEPIRHLGDFEVPVRLAADVTVPVKVSVVPEEAPEASSQQR